MKSLNIHAGEDYDDALPVRPHQAPPPAGRQPLMVIWNRRGLLLFAVAVGMLTAFGLFLASTPLYRATAHLLLQDTSPVSTSTSAVAELKEKVHSSGVLALALNNPALEDCRSLQGSNRIAQLRDGLKVTIDATAQEMDLSFESSYRDEVGVIANEIAKAFKQITTQARKSAADEALAAIAQQKQQYEQELSMRSKEKLEFQRQVGAIAGDLDRSGQVASRLNELRLALMNKHNDVLGDKATYEMAVRLSGLSDDQIKGVTDKQQFNGRSILLAGDDSKLREQLYMAQQKLAELQQRYLEKHPAIIAARENAEYLEASYLAALYQRWMTSRRQEDVLQNAIDEERHTANELSIKAVQFAQLDAELKSTQKSLDMLEAQKLAITPPPETHTIEVSNIDYAQTPTLPVRPILWSYLLQGLLIGLIIGMAGSFVDGRLRSLTETRAATGLPVLAIIPHMPSTQTPATRGRKFQLDPTSEVAEAYRTVRSAIYLNARGKTILVTSPSRGDGKTTVAANLAIAMAEGGHKVLLIDGDMREPMQHRIFATSADVGISSIVAGRASVERAAQTTPARGLDLLPCGPVPFNPAETINNQAFADMLAEINSRYDYVVIDSPPVNAVTDARILAAMCDVTVLVIRSSRTTRRAAADARDGLLGFGANLLGVIINDGPRQLNQGYDMAPPRRPNDKPADITPPPRTGDRVPPPLLAASRRRR